MDRLAVGLVLAAAAAAGCGPTRGSAAPGAPQAVLSRDEVLRAHNAWADSIQHVWSRAAILLNFPTGDVDDQGRGKRLQQDLDGHLFLQKPENLFIHGQVLGHEVFAVGMNPRKFWLWVRPRVNTVWVGDRGGAWESRFVVAPKDLMTAIGAFRIDLGAQENVAFVVEDRHYVLAEDRALDGKRVPMRRVWFDRQTLRPARVDLFDERGRCILMAELMRYERTGRVDVCTVFRARFYGDEEVDLVLRLSGVDLEKRINPPVFEYRPPEGAVEKNLDEMK